jgi:Mrp family chromosome partitioning ATPase
VILVAIFATMAVCIGFLTTSELLRNSPRPAGREVALEPPSGRLAAATHPDLGVAISTIDDYARRLRGAGEAGRRIAVFGTSRSVGTTLASITLARALALEAKAVLVDLALGAPNLGVISMDPAAPGIADVVRGAASYGEIITRDRLSRLHLVAAGRVGADGAAIIASQRLTMMLEALARSYDHVIIDAGAVTEAAVERLLRLAPCAVLIGSDLKSPETKAARERLAGAGYTDIAVFDGAPIIAAGTPKTEAA